MKTFDRRGWTWMATKAIEVQVYRKDDVSMLVRYEDYQPDVVAVEYCVWGDPEVRYETEQEALAAAELASRMRSDEKVH